MSSPAEVLALLEKTGTGEAKVEAMRRHLEANPSLGADEFCAWVEREVSPVTAEKARHLAAGRPLAQLLGQPPPRSEEKKAMDVAAQVTRLVDILAEKGLDRQAEAQALGIGAPRRLGKKEE